MSGNNLAWHYTSLGSLIHILRDRALMATEVGFQNDPYETRAAHEALRSALDGMRTQDGRTGFGFRATFMYEEFRLGSPYALNDERLLASSRFILCASRDSDNFHAWRTYGSAGSVGCAIGLDRSVPLGVVDGAEDTEVTPWRDVQYSESDLAAAIRDDLDDLAARWREIRGEDELRDDRDVLHTGLRSIWNDVRAQAKHASYRHEDETRITVAAPPKAAVRFRDGRLGPRPYILLGTSDAWASPPPQQRTKLPIREVVLGPEAPAAAVESLTWLLGLHDYIIDGETEFATIRDEHGRAEVADWVSDKNKVRIRHSHHLFRSV
ncbi:DUF2971 domain-containing protein [Microbacterium sp. NPDC089696]|uniref:DUF2971 domain-containing protein n=1 Tax=Microbacterium sp. NPDC089696 TaxID=3364199 RepID=UPI0038124EF8